MSRQEIDPPYVPPAASIPPWEEKWLAERPRVVMAGTYDIQKNQDRVLALFEDDAGSGFDSYQRDSARATLAAAAPDLYRACEKLMQIAMWGEDARAVEPAKAIYEGRQALRKARGELR